MKPKTKRAGLALFVERHGVDVVDATPRARLADCIRRAVKYKLEVIDAEISFITKILDQPRHRLTTLLALTSLERGLALLDTGAFLNDVRRDWKMSKGRPIGTAQSIKVRQTENETRNRKIVADYKRFIAALSSYEKMGLNQLLADFEITAKTRHSFSKRNIKSALAQHYGLTRPAITAILGKTKVS